MLLLICSDIMIKCWKKNNIKKLFEHYIKKYIFIRELYKNYKKGNIYQKNLLDNISLSFVKIAILKKR